MICQAAVEQPTVSMTALFMRWLVLVVVALDLISAPLHAHAHDMGPDQFLGHSHGDEGMHEDLLDVALHAEAVDHALGHHASAALRSAEREPVSTPSLAAIVADVAALQAVEPELAERGPWLASADHIPIPSRCTLRPEGRAPPGLHS
jgi:hypothetical protein